MRLFRPSNQKTCLAGYQSHHLVPVAVYRKSSINPLLKSLRPLGFDPFDFSTNGILLPALERTAIESGLPLHRGPHPQYNQMVAERVAAITHRLALTPACQKTRIDTAQRLHWLQQGLRRALMAPPYLPPLNWRDPMARHVRFCELEQEIDYMWVVTAQH